MTLNTNRGFTFFSAAAHRPSRTALNRKFQKGIEIPPSLPFGGSPD